MFARVAISSRSRPRPRCGPRSRALPGKRVCRPLRRGRRLALVVGVMVIEEEEEGSRMERRGNKSLAPLQRCRLLWFR